MENVNALTELAAIAGAGVVAAFIFVRFKLQTILGYLLAGVLLSVFAPQFHGSEFIANIAQLGAAMLLFTIGIEFSLERVRSIFGIAVGGAVIQAALTIFVGMLIFPLLGFSQYVSFFLATMIAMSSTAFVVKMLELKGLTHTRAGNVMLGWLVVQDVLIVLWFLLLATFAPTTGETGNIFLAVIKALVVISITFAVGKYLLPPLLRQVAKQQSEELLLVSVIGTIALFAVFANLFEISFTLGAFLAGLALSETFLNHEIFTEVKPLRDIFMMVFFVSIGSLVNFPSLLENWAGLLGILLILIPVKIIVIVCISLWFKLHIKEALQIGLGISQIGEFAFLGAQIALGSKWIEPQIYSLIVAATVITMAATPALFSQSERLYQFLERRIRYLAPNLHRGLFLAQLPTETGRAGKYESHVILCGYGRVGSYVAAAMHASRVPFVAIEMNAELAEINLKNNIDTIYGDASNAEILKQAGIESARVLVVALPQNSNADIIIKRARELNPNLKIIVRAHHQSEVVLSEADDVIEPEFEAAIEIIRQLYKRIRRQHERAIDIVRQIKTLP
jgi:CPA2 family monovalent cation:H+ antiporter-2